MLTQLRSNFQLPIDDDYLYEEFGIEKPKDYKAQKKAQEDEQKLQEKQEKQQTIKTDSPEPSEPENSDKKSFKNRLKSFFAQAPQDGADLGW